PEYVLHHTICQANDMFSLGCLAYAVHNKGVSLLKTFNSFHTYEKQVKQLGSHSFQSMPRDLQAVIRLLLRIQPDERMNPTDFQNSSYFDNLLVSTMKFLESFPEKTREEKAQFMKGLARVLGQFPERVLKRKILHSLLEELKDHQLLPFTIPNIFIITQKLSTQEFCELVLPSLKPVFQVRDPPQNMIVLLEKLDMLQQKTPRDVFRDDVMPLVYAALESPTSVVQERALRIIPSLAESLDYTAVKSSLFPRVQTLFVQTTILSVKVSTLICFHSMIKVLDKFTLQEKLVPLLRNIKTKEPAVMLATLAVYDEVGKIADKEIIATEILPQLWRMSFGPLLNLEQFQKFIKTIRDLTDRVEEAHVKHLKEVKSLEEQTKSVNESPTVHVSPNLGDEVSFESLVKGNASPTGNAYTSPMTSISPTPIHAIIPTPITFNAPSPKKASNNLSQSDFNIMTSSHVSQSSFSPQTSNHASRSNFSPQTSNHVSQGNFNSMASHHASQASFAPMASNNVSNFGSTLNNTFPSSNTFSIQPPLSNTPITPSMTNLSSSMSLLMPTSSSSSSSTNKSSSQLNKASLHAFDPLG
ncbi:hypothetical protein BD560DRAFT_417650, partial [Blakeslea trispora]